MRYHVCRLSFENQYLLWSVYVRPYFTNVAPLLETQTKTTQNSFHAAWRMSFKTFLGLPACTPAAVLNRILHSSEITCSEAAQRNAAKIARRFGGEAITRDEPIQESQQERQEEQPHAPMYLKKFPPNFKSLFAFAGKQCSCHNRRLTYNYSCWCTKGDTLRNG